MSTPAAAPVNGALPPPSAISFGRLVRMEFRKAVNTVAGLSFLLAIAVLILVVEGVVTVIVMLNDADSRPSDFAGVAQIITSFTLPILAIMLVTSEWTQRTAMVTFTVEPRRPLVLAAKFVVGLLISLAATLLSLLLGVLCTAIASFAGVAVWEIDGGQLAGFFVVSLLAMSIGFALACLLLNTPAAIVLFFVYRILPLLAFNILAALYDWFEKINPYINFEHSQGPIYDWSMDTGEEWAQFLVSGFIWLVVPLTIGIWRILRAEVK